jgi:cytochrome P450
LGAPLARAEALIAIRLLFERLPTLALADEEFDWRPNPNFRGLTRLKVQNANMRPVSLLQPAALELG